MNSGRIVERRDQVLMGFFVLRGLRLVHLANQVVINERTFFD